MARSKDISRYLANWQKEVDGTALYLALAEIEKQPQLAEVYRRMAASEENHTAFWEKRLKDAGAKISPQRPSWRARVMRFLARRFGANFVLPSLTAGEKATSGDYDSQPEPGIGSMSADEKFHARMLGMVSGGPGGLSGGAVAQLEGRHKTGGGNALRAAVLGANDGLVSILSLVMGVAGANLPGHEVFIAGIAGLLAGAGSMALGEWLSVQSSRELYANQIKIEKEELDHNPVEEQEELALIYQAKGLSEARARDHDNGQGFHLGYSGTRGTRHRPAGVGRLGICGSLHFIFPFCLWRPLPITALRIPKWKYRSLHQHGCQCDRLVFGRSSNHLDDRAQRFLFRHPASHYWPDSRHHHLRCG